MSRIAVHLTVSSAALGVLALVTQATGFGSAFYVLSIGLTSTILVLGTLTGVRVHNASREDAVIIVGMNRPRRQRHRRRDTGGLIADAVAADPLITTLAGLVAGVGYLAMIFEVARLSFAVMPLEPRFPTPDREGSTPSPGV